jgi:N-acetylmuramoyl-L-alanine amidase
MRPHRVKLTASLVALAFIVTCSAPQHDDATRSRHRRAVLHPASLRPAIVPRATWHADEHAVTGKPLYDTAVSAVFVHHTDNPNDYDCADVPAMLQAMEEEHIHYLGWDDLGYNFVVDRCGTVYEGRAGGVDRAVRGAHSEGFNAHSVGIAALGNFGAGRPVPAAMLRSIAATAAWKLAPGIDPLGRVRLTSSSDESRFPKGTSVRLNAISGHRDVFETDCPGDALYNALPEIRRTAARLRQAATWPG